MINTKCSECMFSNEIKDSKPITGCTKNIINKLIGIKNIVQENNYNVIEEYACRYGFSKKIYEEHKDKFEGDTLNSMIQTNSRIRYYLLLDCEDGIDFDQALLKLSSLSHKPSAVSFMFRSLSFRPFLADKHTGVCNSLFSDIKWKAHNFLHNIDLNDAINNILATNAQANHTSHFLVYNAKDLNLLDKDLNTINDNIILYQKPMVAMIEKNTSLHKFCISFQNYIVAKNISFNLLEAIKNEPSVLYY